MNEKRKLFIADLHIHTPSSKCYNADKSDSSYLDILKSARKKEISIIAITDHNSIDGYRKITSLKSNILEEIKVLGDINDSQQAQKKQKELRAKINYFKDLLIIPGIEFEVNNGIHLLCLFNPETPLQEIENFLNRGGYEKEDYGQEIANKISKWDIFQFFEETKKHDCIVLDAHTDSDKGILETMRNGLPRANCLSSPQLRGLCYKSEKQRSLLEKTLEASNDYQRDIPLAFLKASDAHNIEDVGKDTTYFQLKELTYKEFKEAFDNPIEYISTTLPEIRDIVNRIINSGKCYATNEFEADNIQKYICSFNNTIGGFIILGANQLGGITGFTEEDLNSLMDEFEASIRDLPKKTDLMVNIYPIKNDRYIIIVNVRKGNKLIDINNNGEIWVFINRALKKLSAEEIEKVIEKRTTDILQGKILSRLKKIEAEALEVKNSLFSLPIIQKIEAKSIEIHSIIASPTIQSSLRLSNDNKEILKQYVKTKNNGKSKGNIFFFEEIVNPRLNNAVLRYSIPKFYLKKVPNHTSRNEQIVIVPGGATFFSNKTIEQYNENELGLLIIKSSDNSYSNKFICSYLKSSLFLWYFNFIRGTLDFYLSNNFKLVSIPKIYPKNPHHLSLVRQIEGHFNTILEKETTFLKIDLTPDHENYYELIDSHNKDVDKYASKIDTLIYDLLELTPQEIDLIESSLIANDIHVPKNS